MQIIRLYNTRHLVRKRGIVIQQDSGLFTEQGCESNWMEHDRDEGEMREGYRIKGHRGKDSGQTAQKKRDI